MSNAPPETIRVICPNCGSKINAKPHLVGETRPCPKCKEPLKILVPEDAASLPSIPIEEPHPEAPHLVGNRLNVAPVRHMEQLNVQHRYLIFDRVRLIASWANDGKNWQLKTHTGFASAVRNPDKIPNEGDFKLVELKLDHLADGVLLRGLMTYQLAERWALLALLEGDNVICEKITGPGGLNREQKFLILQNLREHFMPDVWSGASAVLEFLGNNDFAASGVDEKKSEE